MARREPNSRSAEKSRAQRLAVVRGFSPGPCASTSSALRRQIAGADRVVETFAGDRIHQARGVAHRHPAVAGDAIALPRPCFERRQHVAVESRALPARCRSPPCSVRAARAAPAPARPSRRSPPKDDRSAGRPRCSLRGCGRNWMSMWSARPARNSRARAMVSVAGQLRADVAQRIARARRDDAEIGVERARLWSSAASRRRCRSMPSTRVFSICAPARSARSSSMRFRS